MLAKVCVKLWNFSPCTLLHTSCNSSARVRAVWPGPGVQPFSNPFHKRTKAENRVCWTFGRTHTRKINPVFFTLQCVGEIGPGELRIWSEGPIHFEKWNLALCLFGRTPQPHTHALSLAVWAIIRAGWVRLTWLRLSDVRCDCEGLPRMTPADPGLRSMHLKPFRDKRKLPCMKILLCWQCRVFVPAMPSKPFRVYEGISQKEILVRISLSLRLGTKS